MLFSIAQQSKTLSGQKCYIHQMQIWRTAWLSPRTSCMKVGLVRLTEVTVMIRFSALLPISAPIRISAPFECGFVNKRPYSNKCPHSNKQPHSYKLLYSFFLILQLQPLILILQHLQSTCVHLPLIADIPYLLQLWYIKWRILLKVTELSTNCYCYSFFYC